MNELISPTVKMDKPNEPVIIYEGLAEVKIGDLEEKVEIRIFHSWIPTSQVKFNFSLNSITLRWLEIALKLPDKNIEIKIGNFPPWEASITGIKETDQVTFTGFLIAPITTKNRNYKIKRIDFSLFNFRTYFGNKLQVADKSYGTGELRFEAEDHALLIHSIKSNKEQKDAQRQIGGYIFTNSCRLEFKETGSFKRVDHLRKRLGVFLSFINGRRTYPKFIKAYTGSGNPLWEDYSPYHVDQYKFVVSWMPFKIEKPFGELWHNFQVITKDDDDFEKIGFVVHWYLEALNNSGHTKGSIIMLQTAFEILYNWLVEEEGAIKPYTENKGKKQSASNKLRTLFSHYKISLDFPLIYTKVFDGVRLIDRNTQKEKVPPFDFSFWYTEIRNLFVHFSEVDSRNLNKLPHHFDWYLLNTAIFNLEVILLKMMNYNGIITSRLQTNSYRARNQVHLNSPYKTLHSQ